MKKRLLSITLLIALLTSCGETAPVETTSDTTTSEVTTEVEIISSALPTVNYGGHEFRILTQDSETPGFFCYEFDAEQTGDTMNDAVYKRNLAVEDRFGVNITMLASTTYIEQFKSSVLAGDDSYDVLTAPSSSVVANGYMYGLPVDELPYIDLEKDWWDKLYLPVLLLNKANTAQYFLEQ